MPTRLLLALIPVVLLAPPAAVAGPGPAPAESAATVPPPPPPPSVLKAPLEDLSPLARDLRLRLEAADEALAAAEAGLAAAKTPDERARQLRRIADLKQQTERDLLSIQLEHARAEGRAEDVARLEAALAGPARAEVPVHPASRPAPARN